MLSAFYWEADDDLRQLILEIKQLIPDANLIKFGLPEADYVVHIDSKSARILQKDQDISIQQIASSQLIINLSTNIRKPDYVQIELSEKENSKFAKREWNDLFSSILNYWYNQTKKTTFWVNPPNLNNFLETKTLLLLTSSDLGFSIPDFIISNLLPKPKADQKKVVKAISQNQFVNQTSRVTTRFISDQFLYQNKGKRLPVPSLFQQKINIEHELRVYYFLESFVCLKLLTDAAYEDIRTIPESQVECKEVSMPEALKDKVKKLCEHFKLGYCCFDFLAQEGDYFLTDINPNGSWLYYEKAFSIPISKKLAKIAYDFIVKPYRT